MRLFTVGELARLAGVPVHRITYVIESRGIDPCAHAGQARVFSEAAAQQILAELRAIQLSRKTVDARETA